MHEVKRISHEVIDVEKTVSPHMLRGAPKARPENVCPVFKCRDAGITLFAIVAKPRVARGIRVR